MSARQVVLDTETTGLNHHLGDRIIEIGCVELVNRRPSGRNLHVYINPEREIETGALAVHGLTREFLSDKPRFADVLDMLLRFVEGAELLIHNAAFDEAFLDAEFRLLNLPAFRQHAGVSIVDTLALAKELHPGKRNSLDALCERYEISNAHRTLHGALLDAELLAEVYLAMTRGQESLVIDIEEVRTHETTLIDFGGIASLPVILANADELAEHDALLAGLAKEIRRDPVWLASAQT